MSVWKLSPNECRTLDLSNPDELLRYAKKLIGHSFREVLMLSCRAFRGVGQMLA